jgi:TM2 domain-containing membrane protein YozV/predicted Ser/Thr protein kinase
VDVTNSLSSRATVQETDRRDKPPQPEEIASHFPSLDVVDLLGFGGMGMVYKARQRSLDRFVALKILKPAAASDAAFAERFHREARALAKLHHPNIVGIHDSGDSGGLYYFIMEYVDGANLRRLMDRGRLDPKQGLEIIRSVCDALQYAHDEGIAHRDIKPENILIDVKGRVKIADFGLAKILSQTRTSELGLTSPAHIMGTMHYMAPEQIETPMNVDHRADIYALGVIFYELLTGELPIGRFPMPSEKSPGSDVRLDSVVLRALEKDPGKRYQRISEVRGEVDRLSQPAAVGAGGSGVRSGALSGGASIGASIGAQVEDLARAMSQERQVWLGYVLWCACAVGFFGIHRFYAGRYISGVVWLLTFGLLFVGQFVDLFLIPEMIHRANWETVMKRQSRAAASSQGAVGGEAGNSHDGLVGR